MDFRLTILSFPCSIFGIFFHWVQDPLWSYSELFVCAPAQTLRSQSLNEKLFYLTFVIIVQTIFACTGHPYPFICKDQAFFREYFHRRKCSDHIPIMDEQLPVTLDYPSPSKPSNWLLFLRDFWPPFSQHFNRRQLNTNEPQTSEITYQGMAILGLFQH